ncbi:cysteine desulfurase [Corynebacterium sp. MC-04]|uniref:Cysteine desulfurase n=1 Tax=Corynebacterium parakroppenstedtii TaxID=2828363 RepID=A0ABS9HK54_9CORY|nr:MULTISPECIES: cysteine desulfurase family protein [Corynebacterium]KXB51186.1 aminotransferase, class V [Corynebacterium kroppenstedtii]MBY0792066.1 cysteine desulfurase [Corynebacterium parakroppenstedtii]MCF6769015.1 cysteine desulfurase [Corynebacterium parakroppenstedtii]MCF6771125.1 cysteine desulfurase [Corynebacterium parakroppenstedtii]MCF6773215.1 cysteine desulfurase [Corynebacterium parakroppenstedtii]
MDHAATSPLRQVAKDAIMDSWDLLNPGGQYASGRDARKAVEEARETIARLLGAEPIEVIFTASGTEADNLAVQGLYAERAQEKSSPHRVIVGSVEHPAVLEPAKASGTDPSSPGPEADVIEVPVDSSGHYRTDFLADVLTDGPAALMALQWANNETGALQPVDEIASLAAEHNVPWHADAVQAVGHVPVDFHSSGATTIAASAHKFGGPRSTGLLLCGRATNLHKILRGGGQERSIRPGTLNVAGAVGTAAALSEACHEMEAERARLSGLRDRLLSFISREIPDSLIHTAEPALPGHVHVSFPGAEGDSLIMLLDQAGFDASTGSACAAGVNRVSHVVMAIGVESVAARGTLRFTLGRTTSEKDVAALEAVLPKIVEQARAAGMA